MNNQSLYPSLFKNKAMQKKIEEMKQKSEKIGKYGKYVKDMFQPKASLKKKHELTELNKRLQTIPR